MSPFLIYQSQKAVSNLFQFCVALMYEKTIIKTQSKINAEAGVS